MITSVRRELARAGVEQAPEVVLADAGYSHHVQMQRLAGERPDGPRSARRQQARRRAAGLGRRALCVHAPRLGQRAGRRALRQAPGDDRAGLRRHQVQPPHRPLLTPRPSGHAVGMASHECRPQPAQALAEHHGAPASPERPPHTLFTASSETAQTLPRSRSPPAFTQQPPWKPAAVAARTFGPLVVGLRVDSP
jgi:hypothetical protein